MNQLELTKFQGGVPLINDLMVKEVIKGKLTAMCLITLLIVTFRH